MYRPKNGTRQRGGQYVTNTAPPSAISTQGISQSSLQYISRRSQLSTFGEVSNLSLDQISSLIIAINEQIAVDEQMIAQNQAQISGIDYEISRSGGLQDQYNIAEADYLSTLTAYINTSTMLQTNQQVLTTKLTELYSLSSMSDSMMSSISGYEQQFSSILLEIRSLDSQIDVYEAQYKKQLDEYDEYSRQYSTYLTYLNSTIEAMNQNSVYLSTAVYEYVSTSTFYETLEIEYEEYTLNVVIPAREMVISTQKEYDAILARISTQYHDTLNLSSVLEIARLDLVLARSYKQYRDSVSKELSSITDLNSAQAALDAIVKGLVANPRDSTLLAQKASAETVVSTLSAYANSATQDRIQNEQNQKQVESVNLAQRLAIADRRISTAADYLVSAQANEANVISTISSISTRIGISRQRETNILSTMSSFSTLYANQQAEYDRLSAIISDYDSREATLNQMLQSTIQNLNNYINISTMYASNSDAYMSTYIYYSTLETYTTSSIAGYEAERAQVVQQISQVDADVADLNNQISAEFTNLRTYGPQFYNYKKAELISEVEEYQYTMNQINTMVGMTVADLILKKMTNLNNKDYYNFELTANRSLTDAKRAEYSGIIQQLTTEVSQIDRLIQVLNPLEIQFKALLDMVLDEKTLKTQFIDIRREMFDMEVTVYEDDGRKASVLPLYEAKFQALNTKASEIRAKMQLRNNAYTVIKAVLRDDGNRAPLMTILGGIQRFPDSLLDVTIDNGVIPDEIRSATTATSDYAVLPPIPI